MIVLCCLDYDKGSCVMNICEADLRFALLGKPSLHNYRQSVDDRVQAFIHNTLYSPYLMFIYIASNMYHFISLPNAVGQGIHEAADPCTFSGTSQKVDLKTHN